MTTTTKDKGTTGRAAFGAALATMCALVVMALALGRAYVIGAGIALVAAALYRGWAEGQHGDHVARRRAAGVLGGVVGGCVMMTAIMAGAYVSYERFFTAACAAADRTKTLAERRAAWSAVRSHAWLADRLGATYMNTCYEETVFDDHVGGTCPDWPLDDVPCACGPLKWPSDGHCSDKRAFCGCIAPSKACASDAECCSGSCLSGACTGGTWSGAVRTLHCVTP